MVEEARPLRRYGIAAASAVAAVILRLPLDPVLGHAFPFATLFFAVLLAAGYGGFGPAMLATGLGAVGSMWFLLEPRGSWLAHGVESQGGLLFYLAVSTGIAFIGHRMRKAQRQAEASLQEVFARAERLRVTMGSIGDAVITADVEGRITSMNKVAAELTGWTATEAVGRPLEEIFRIINEESLQAELSPVTKVLRAGHVVGLANHTVLVARDGTRRPIDDSAAPIRDQEGNLVGVVLVFRDISARRRAEQELEQSEQELNDFFENATIGLHWVGPDGTILRVNQAELAMLGYGRDEYVGRHISEFHVDAEVIEDILRRLGAGETVTDRPARLRCKDGSIKNVVINSSVLWRDGRFVHTRCFTLDVTDRVKGETAQALLAAIVASSEDAIVTKTLEGVITSWNKGAERVFEYDASEAIGQKITLIVPDDRLDEERMIIERLRRGERIEHFETVRRAKSGRLLDISLTVSPLRDPSGRIIGASKVARDVTARKRADARLRVLAAVVEQSSDFIGISGPDFMPLFVNEAGWRMVGFDSLEEALRTPVADYFWPEDRARMETEALPALLRDGRWRGEVRFRNFRDDTPVDTLWNVTAIRDAAGEVIAFATVSPNLTAIKATERALRESRTRLAEEAASLRASEDALRRADQRKDEFLATLAHELRNPLAPVRNSLEIMKRAGGDTDLLERARATIDRQMSHLERLVDDLLDASRITQDKLVLRRQRVELAAVLRQTLETCRPLAEASRQQIEVSLPPEPIQLDADPVRLCQVFSNLLNNACKYTPAGGRIRIAARREGDEAIVSVRDSGAGIGAADLSRIFEMFTQLPSSTDDTQGGLGIGLTIVRRLVQMHGGEVEVTSQGKGRGSEFVVRLPIALGAAPAVEPTPPPHVAKRRVLVVDDNADAADSLAILLDLAGHETRVARDGLEAIDAAEAFRPDLVLLDIGLPKLNGYEAARRIRERAWSRHTVLVALTGWGQDQDKQRSQEAGFDVHVVKPVESATLQELLARQRPAAA